MGSHARARVTREGGWIWGESSRPGQQMTLGEAADLGLRWPGGLAWQLGMLLGLPWLGLHSWAKLGQNLDPEPNKKERDKT